MRTLQRNNACTMTIREIFSKADVKTVSDFFCPAPIIELYDERVHNICRGLKFYSENSITDATTDKGNKIPEEQARIVWRHFLPPMTDIYKALGIDCNDEKEADEKIQNYLNQEVTLRNGENINTVAIRLIQKMHGMKH